MYHGPRCNEDMPLNIYCTYRYLHFSARNPKVGTDEVGSGPKVGTDEVGSGPKGTGLRPPSLAPLGSYSDRLYFPIYNLFE
jgi:hypothetical protein